MATEDEILASLGLTQAQITHITKTNVPWDKTRVYLAAAHSRTTRNW